MTEKFPNNSTFTAKVIQIHTLAARFAATADKIVESRDDENVGSFEQCE